MAEEIVSSAVRFCPTCNKPFTPESTSFSRHVSYCRRAQSRRVRRKSCRACKTAKAKCSFDTRCSRCAAKSIDCIYDRTNGSSRESTTVAEEGHVLSDLTTSILHQQEPPLTETYGFIDESLLNLTAFDHSQLDFSPISSNTDIVAAFPSFTPSSFLDGITLLPDAWDAPPKARQPFTFPSNSSLYLSRVQLSNALALHSAELIVESLYAMPAQMMRRETFPPFIHPHWHLDSLPEPLAICMQMARMYASPDLPNRGLVWRTILAEQRRAVERLHLHSPQELLSEMQAGMIYLLMRLVDGVNADLEWNREMTGIQVALCGRFFDFHGMTFCESEQENPSLTHADWIYAESRRRTSLVWFMITRTIVVQSQECATTNMPWTLPLPAPKTLWEARSEEDWMREMGAGSPELNTFGSLVRAKQKNSDREQKQVLGAWNARADTLGSLLNVAVSIV